MGCFGTLNSYLYQNFFQARMFIFIQIAKTPLLLGLRQKWMFPSCCLWKVVTFFGKEHVNWSNIYGVMIGRSWKIISMTFLVTPILSFPNLNFQLLLIITPLILDQLTCSLPKDISTFYGKQDGIIHFCLSPNKRVVFSLWIYNFIKKIMDFFKLDCSTSSYHNSN